MSTFSRFGITQILFLLLCSCSMESTIEGLSEIFDAKYKVQAIPQSTSAVEGDLFHIDLSIASPRQVPTTLSWQVVNGNNDFSVSSGTIILPSGSSSITLNLPTIDDGIYEGDETFVLKLSSPDSEVGILPNKLDLTVVDKQSMPTVEFLANSSTVPESVGTHSVAVKLSGPSAFTTTVLVAASAGTADSSDYSLPANIITIPPLSTSSSFDISVVDDALMEANETIDFELSSPNNATMGTKTHHVVTILDNDTTNLTATIAQAPPQQDPTYDLPILFTVTFNRAVIPATFTASDLTQSGTAPGVVWSLSTSDNIVWTISATATGAGTLNPTLPAGKVTDSLGNLNDASTAGDSVVTYIAAPAAFTLTGITGGLDATKDNQLTSGLNPTVNWGASTAADSYDVTIFEADGTTTKCATQNISAPATSYSFSSCNLSYSSTYTATVTAKRTNGTSTNATGSPYTFTTSSALTVAVEQSSGQADPTGTLPISFTATFSHAIDPSTFTIADITQSGTASGITWTLSTIDNITWTIKATAITSEGTLIPSIAVNKVQDLLGNPNAVSSSVDNSVTYQISPGLFNISGITGGSDITADNVLNSGLIPTVSWGSSANATSYDVTIYEVDGTTIACTTVNTTSTSYNFSSCTLTAGNTYKAVVIGKRNSLTQSASNAPFAFTTSTALAVTINQSSGQADPAATLPINFTVVFSRAIDPSTFTIADITQSGTASGITWSLSTADNTTYTLSATAVTNEGTLIPSIAAGAVQDPSANLNAVSNSTDNSVTYHKALGIFNIAGVTGGSDVTVDNALTNGLLATLNWSSSTNADSYDVTIYANDGTTVVCALANTTATSYSFSTCPLTVASTYKAMVTAKRTVGDTLNAANALYTFTTSQPLSVTVNQASGQADPASSLPINFTVVFSHAIDVSSFTTADITQSGTATGITWSLSTSDNTTFTLSATAVTGEGTLIPSIAAGSVVDAVSTTNTASTQTDNSVTYQLVPSAFTISGITGGSDSTADNFLSSGLIPTISWATATNAQSYDVTIYESDGTTVKCATVNTTAVFYNFSSCTLSYSSTYKTSVIAKRSSGTSTTASNSLYSFTTVTPLSVAVEQASGQSDPTSSLPINFTVTFNRAIDPSSFTTADITHSGTATGITWSLSTSDNITYTLSATAVTAQGTLIPSLAAATVQDLFGNSNSASTSTDHSVTYQAAPGAFNITGITGGSDSTADNLLSSGLVPTVNWGSSTNALSYDVTVYESDGTTVKCATQNVSAPTTSYNFSSCTLTYSTNYIATVVAKGPSSSTTVASNSPYSFSSPTALTVAVAQGGSQTDPTSTLPITFTVTFNRAITAGTFTTADIVQNGTASGITWSAPTSADNITWTVTATAVTTEGTLVPSINAGSMTDSLGNANLASTAVDNSVTYYKPPGSFTISGITGGYDSTADASLNTTITALNPTVNWAASTNADSYDVTVYQSNGTTVQCALTNVAAPATSYSFSSCSLTKNTTYKAQVVAKRTSGSSSTTASNSQYSFTTIADLAVSSINRVSSATISSLPAQWTITFNRAIDPATFDVSDISQQGTATGITWSLSTANNIAWTLQATAASSGTLIPKLSASVVADTYTNPNTASSNGQTITYTPAPTAFAITGATGGSDVTADAVLNNYYKVTANWQTSTNATSYDVTIYQSNGTTVACTLVNVAAPATSYSFSSCPLRIGATYKIKVTAKTSSSLDASNSLYSFTTTGTVDSLPVTAAYPTNGANWNSYIQNSTPSASVYQQSDTACDGTGTKFDDCIHGGEIKKADYSTLSSCSSVTAEDSALAFNWICDDSSGHAIFYTTGLNTNKGLKNLITGTSWNDTFLTVSVSGTAVAQSPVANWWTNTITAAPSATSAKQTLSTAGTIYTTSAATIYGYNINADRIALVATGDLTFSPLASANTSTAGESGSNLAAVISAGTQNYLWFESGTTSGAGASAAYGIYLNTVKFSQVRNLTSLLNQSNSASVGLGLISSPANNVQDVSGSYSYTGNSQTGIKLQSSDGIHIKNVSLNGISNGSLSAQLSSYLKVSDSTFAGYSTFPATADLILDQVTLSEFSNLTISSWGIAMTSSSQNTFSNTSISGIIPMALTSSDQNAFLSTTISQVAKGSTNNGVLLTSSSNNAIIGGTFACTDGGRCIYISGGGGNTVSAISATSNQAGNYNPVVQVDSSVENILSSLTLSSSSGGGIKLYSANRNILSMIVAVSGATSVAASTIDTSANNVITHLVSLNTSFSNGLTLSGSSTNLFSQLATKSGSFSTDFVSATSSNNVFTGYFIFNSGCTVSGTTPGIMTTTCAASGSSSHTVFSGKSMASSYNSGYLTLKTADTILLNRSEKGNSANTAWVDGAACPPAVDPTLWSITDQRTTPKTWLVNAKEISGDNIGNDDGLCEPGEACIYAPNIGQYQGSGDYTTHTCVMPAGSFASTIMYAYPVNGQ